jgi:hypothetical protein
MRMKIVLTKEFDVPPEWAFDSTPEELSNMYFDEVMEDISQEGVEFLFPHSETDNLTIEITEITDAH